LAHLFRDIDQASQSIDFEMYLFDLDELGQRMLEALRRAAQRGVRVRVMVDGVGSPDWNRTLLNELAESGVEARIFRPYPWVRWGARAYSKLLNLRNLFRWFQRLNRRDHRKMCLIDRKTAWAGSFNITRRPTRSFD
jgi:cardiolipin synthase